MYPAVIYRGGIVDLAMMWDHRTESMNSTMYPNIALALGLNLLNFYWYFLIWRKLFRLMGKIFANSDVEDKSK